LAAPLPSTLPYTPLFRSRLSAGEIIAGSARVGRTAAAANIDDGKFTLTVGEAQFYGGRAEARLSAAMNGDALEASAEAKLDEVRSEEHTSELQSRVDLVC